MLQEEGLQWQHSRHYLCQNTNGWKDEVLGISNIELFYCCLYGLGLGFFFLIPCTMIGEYTSDYK